MTLVNTWYGVPVHDIFIYNEVQEKGGDASKYMVWLYLCMIYLYIMRCKRKGVTLVNTWYGVPVHDIFIYNEVQEKGGDASKYMVWCTCA